MAGSMADNIRNDGTGGRWRAALAFAAALLLVAAMADAHRHEMRADGAATAAPIRDPDPLVDSLRAQLRVRSPGHASSEPVRRLVARALAVDPGQPLALALLGDAAYERADLALARASWVTARSRAQAADADLVEALDRRVARLDSSQRVPDAADTPGAPGAGKAVPAP